MCTTVDQPKGLPPVGTFQSNRAVQIQRAVNRYMAAGLAVPEEWIREYNGIVEIIENCKQ